jgi:nucleotide-binding universal stress UspA family protein
VSAEQQATDLRDHIVVGVDGSQPSKQALRWAQFLAQVTNTTIEVVAAWQPFIAVGGFGGPWATMPADWNPVKDATTFLDATIDEVFGKERPAGLQITVREGNPAQVLLEASRSARMLVVGSRGHGGFSGLLLGSVSTACAEHASCPVLVLHGDTAPPKTHSGGSV